MTLPRKAIRTLLALIAIGLILPTFYLAGFRLTERNAGTLQRESSYSAATLEAPLTGEIQLLLEKLAQTMGPSDLNRLRNELSVVPQISGASGDPLQDYITTLSDFTGNMSEIQARLARAKTYISTGQTQDAKAEVTKLKRLKANTESLLNSLYSLLDRIHSYYGIDLTEQRQRIIALDTLFQTSSKEINQLATTLEPRQGFIQTILTLNASKREAFINESFLVYGSLKDQNGTALVGRNVTISWGVNETVFKETDLVGRFEVTLLFPPGSPGGLIEIQASFEPVRTENETYLPSTSVVTVLVVYQQSAIAAAIYPEIAKPLDFVYVNGTLSDSDKKPIENRPIAFSLDGALIGSAETLKNGSFWFRFVVSQSVSNGTHTVAVAYDAVGDRFATSNVTLSFTVQLQETTIMVTLNPTSVFSGNKIIVNGTIAYANDSTSGNRTAPMSGEVSTYLDNIRFATVKVNDDGTFASVITVPLGFSLGSHSLRIQYDPDIPWVSGTRTVREVFVYNIPLIVLAAAVISASSTTASYLVRRKRRAALRSRLPRAQPPVELKAIPDEFSSTRLISAIEAEPDHTKKITKTYSLAQAIVKRRLGESPRDSETPWEYVSRVATVDQSVREPLTRLAELFELAEYSPYHIDRAQSEEAKAILLKLRETFQNVK